MKRNHNKLFIEIIFIIMSLIFLVPLWMVVINSLKERKYANLFGIWFEGKISAESYITVFKEGNITKALFNAVFISFTTTILVVIVTSMAAFIICRSNGKLPKIFFYILISGMVVPPAMVPTYWILKALNQINTYNGIILVYTTFGLPFSVFLYTGFIKTISRELDEAAAIDGCGMGRLFFQVIFPLLKSITVTVFIFHFIGAWNDVQLQLFFSNADKWTLPMTVYGFFSTYAQNWNLVFADIVIATIPMLIVYFAAQKYIVAGMTAGAVKG